MEVAPGVYPAFADCKVGARPSGRIMWYVNRRFDLELDDHRELAPSAGGHLYEALMYAFPSSASRGAQAGEPVEAAVAGTGSPRSWFDRAGVLISRPGPDSRAHLAVALKGGHNAEHHNHNDVGSYVAVAGNRAVLLDPGGEVYTGRTFSSRRYESDVLNSFGHPVPRVSGKLQRKGRDARAEVLRTEFTDLADTITFDISSAYDVDGLESLRRTFVYSREGEGSLTVTDEVELSRPADFGTALITLGEWKRREDGSILVYDFDEAVDVRLAAEGGELTVKAEEIEEDVRTRSLPVRIGVDFARPVRRGSISLKITPASFGERERGGLLKNGGFELGSFAWDVPRGGMGSVTDERASAGGRSLRIADERGDRGSAITSARAAAAPGPHVLRGKVYVASGSGLGLYVRLYDRAGRMLNERDERGWISSMGTLGGEPGRWRPFSFRFEAPAGTSELDVWIHSYNAARVDAFLDELSVERAE
jgi:hypothetical protein